MGFIGRRLLMRLAMLRDLITRRTTIAPALLRMLMISTRIVIKRAGCAYFSASILPATRAPTSIRSMPMALSACYPRIPRLASRVDEHAPRLLAPVTRLATPLSRILRGVARYERSSELPISYCCR